MRCRLWYLADMVTSTTVLGRKASSVRNIFMTLFGLNVSNKEYTVAILDGRAFGECEKTFTVKSGGSPATIALNLLRENPSLEGKRVWIHDPTLANSFPHRYRLLVQGGEGRATLIEPRKR